MTLNKDLESEKQKLQKEIANLKEVEIVQLKQENEKISKSREEQEKLAQGMKLSSRWILNDIGLDSEKKTLEEEVSNAKEMIGSLTNLCKKLEDQCQQHLSQNGSLKVQLEEERANNST